MLSFGGLAMNLGVGAASEAFKRTMGFPSDNGYASDNVFISERNAQVLVDALCRMRGAALKLGQMLSIQDEAIIPKELVAIFDRVRQDADIMPKAQLEKILSKAFGEGWRSTLLRFEDKPVAAASIGQVHRAVLLDGTEAAMKIQYPGVASSIESDVANLARVLKWTNVMPRGMYLENALDVLGKELAQECDYIKEAANQKKMRELVGDNNDNYYVPKVFDSHTTTNVLTTEYVRGVPMEKLISLSQEERDHIGALIMDLCLKELFVWRFMQIDPNFSNFLYDGTRINLLDFGACLSFSDAWVESYLEVIKAASENDRDKIWTYSIKLGFVSGQESKRMKDAHIESVLSLGLPFAAKGAYDFKAQTVTHKVRENIPTMVNERLTPPPNESYSLHRKLAGAFLLCTKIEARVPVRGKKKCSAF